VSCRLIGFAFQGPNSTFAVKGSRAVTHFKRLLPGAKSLKLLLDRSRALREHLGPILWQLPPTLKKDSERLQGFLQTLDREIRHAVEFRHRSWLSDDIFQLLNKYHVAQPILVASDLEGCSPETVSQHRFPAAKLRPNNERAPSVRVAVGTFPLGLSP